MSTSNLVDHREAPPAPWPSIAVGFEPSVPPLPKIGPDEVTSKPLEIPVAIYRQ